MGADQPPYPREEPGVITFYPNTAEWALGEKLKAAGWEVTKNGWPDFACFKGERFVAVEVKRDRFTKVKPRQRAILAALARAGVECFLWSPDVGFQPIMEGGKRGRSQQLE